MHSRPPGLLRHLEPFKSAIFTSYWVLLCSCLQLSQTRWGGSHICPASVPSFICSLSHFNSESSIFIGPSGKLSNAMFALSLICSPRGFDSGSCNIPNPFGIPWDSWLPLIPAQMLSPPYQQRPTSTWRWVIEMVLPLSHLQTPRKIWTPSISETEHFYVFAFRIWIHHVFSLVIVTAFEGCMYDVSELLNSILLQIVIWLHCRNVSMMYLSWWVPYY